MDLEQNLRQMGKNAQVIQQLVQDFDETQARWKPDTNSWSILEVINHLYDEEREDFRTRLDFTLHRPGESWPAIDPEGWVLSRQYNDRSLADSLDKFLEERHASLHWLTLLESPNWDRQYQAPWGAITAGDLMAAWVAHDLLHLRQLVELTWALTTNRLSSYSPEYAGVWSQ
jgi:uncharacterized damage-inducible protein DinB